MAASLWLPASASAQLPQDLPTGASEEADNTPGGDVGVGDYVETPGGRRSYLQGALTKVRPQSYLKLDAPPVPELVELRGALGQQRDALLRRHYARLAALDALADEAGRAHDLRLAEQVETARRRDTQRFFLAMQAIKVRTLEAWAAGGH